MSNDTNITSATELYRVSNELVELQQSSNQYKEHPIAELQMYCEHIHALQQQIEGLNDIVTDQCEIVKQRDDTITELRVNSNKYSNTSQQQPVTGDSSDKPVY